MMRCVLTVAEPLVDFGLAQRTLLAQVIREGSADFIAELVTGHAPSAPYIAYGYENEAAPWRELSPVLHSANTAGWLYGGQPCGRPADVGYFFGYRIAEAYYTTAEDKRKAVITPTTV